MAVGTDSYHEAFPWQRFKVLSLNVIKVSSHC